MTVQETFLANRFETELTAQMGPTELTASMDTTDGPAVPCLLVFAYNDPTKTEYILFDSAKNATNYVASNINKRYQTGSVLGSGITHEPGTKVRSSASQQHFEDAHDRIDFYRDHGNLLGLGDDDHAQYLLRSILTTKGDVYARGASGVERVGVGADGLPIVGKAAASAGIAYEQLGTGGIADAAITAAKLASSLAKYDIRTSDPSGGDLYEGRAWWRSDLGDFGLAKFYDGTDIRFAAHQLVRKTTLGADGAITHVPVAGASKTTLRFSCRGTTAATTDLLVLEIDGDTTNSNYHRQQFQANDGGSNVAEGASNAIATIPGASSPADSFATGEIEIIAYGGARIKQAIARFVGLLDTDNVLVGMRGLVHDAGGTSAIDTSLKLLVSGANLAAGSWAELWIE